MEVEGLVISSNKWSMVIFFELKICVFRCKKKRRLKNLELISVTLKSGVKIFRTILVFHSNF
jgi:hypothetical protein